MIIFTMDFMSFYLFIIHMNLVILLYYKDIHMGYIHQEKSHIKYVNQSSRYAYIEKVHQYDLISALLFYFYNIHLCCCFE